MYPRGSNGAGQAIVDATVLAQKLQAGDVLTALKDYEAERLGATANVVLENRRNPPDAILREIYERTGDRPFERIDAVISAEELKAITDRYKGVAGYDHSSLQR
jgi:2-polyprenyl-6-methoxyphenol hydroxylase-like FAD-dependent oxidoreductase